MKQHVNRRQFLSTLGWGVAASRLSPLHATEALHSSVHSGLSESTHGFHIDPRFTKFGKTPWRKVHLDFHNSKHVPKIGEKFNRDEWGDRLLAGNVDSIVVFAKDMHGYFYYPSKYGPVHPGLSFDLLGEQVRACRERNIDIYAYYCCTWDHYLADQHPEWNMIKPDGTDYRPKPGQTPGWTALCLGNKDFVDLMANHISEYVSEYELDGAWLDMTEPIAPECYCKECLRQIKALGKDPYNKEVQRSHQNNNFLDFHRRMQELVHTTRPGCQVDYNDIGIGKVSERSQWLDNIDLEALPTGGWGYFYAPAHIRYQRNFGIPVYGMTGRFVTAWADFGGLKLPQQLDVELASIVANAARCDVGDQMPPDGRLDPAVYHLFGKSFGRIKELEPWLNNAAPVTEAALMLPAVPMERVRQDYLFGVTKLMIESHIQFDLVEPGQEWEQYKLVVIPDELKPEGSVVKRLHQYISKGGAVIVCHNGGLNADNNTSWVEKYGMFYDGPSPFTPAYMVIDDGFVDDTPGYEYALYKGASQWTLKAPANPLAQLGEPLFQRSAEHYTSHRQTPFNHTTGYSVLAVNGRVGLVGFPLGSSYHDTGYWIYRFAFERLLKEVLPSRLISTNAPLNTELTVTYQPQSQRALYPGRYMVHIVNWSPSRKTTPHPEVHEDPVPLTNIRIKLNMPLNNVRVNTAVSNKTLQHRVVDKGIEVTIPEVSVHEIVCFNFT